jgi:hypothetical protein
MSWGNIALIALCAAMGFGIVWSMGEKKPKD